MLIGREFDKVLWTRLQGIVRSGERTQQHSNCVCHPKVPVMGDLSVEGAEGAVCSHGNEGKRVHALQTTRRADNTAHHSTSQHTALGVAILAGVSPGFVLLLLLLQAKWRILLAARCVWVSTC